MSKKNNISVIYTPCFIRDMKEDTLYFIRKRATCIDHTKETLYINPYEYAVTDETKKHKICIIKKNGTIQIHLANINIMEPTVVSAQPYTPDTWIAIPIECLPLDLLEDTDPDEEIDEHETIEDVWNKKNNSLIDCSETILNYMDFLFEQSHENIFADKRLKDYKRALINIINHIDYEMSENSAIEELLSLRDSLWEYHQTREIENNNDDDDDDDDDKEGEEWKAKREKENSQENLSEEEIHEEQENKYFRKIINAIDAKIKILTQDVKQQKLLPSPPVLPAISKLSLKEFETTIEQYSKDNLQEFLVNITTESSGVDFKKAALARDRLRDMSTKNS